MDEPLERVPRIPPSRRRFPVGRLLLSLPVTVGIVWLLLWLTGVSPRVILRTLGGISPAALLVGLALHVGAYLLRAVRFRVLLRTGDASVPSLFGIVTVHNLLNHFLPFRVGELSYVLLVRSLHGVALSEGVGTLAVCRIMDLMAFALFYPCAVGVLYLRNFDFPPYVWTVLAAVVPLFFVLAGLLLLVAVKGETLVGRLRGLLDRLPAGGRRLAGRILPGLEETARGFRRMGIGTYLGTFCLSLAILGLVYGVGYVLLAGMGFPMRMELVVFCSTLSYLGLLLPIYSLGGFGTVEAGWTAGCLMAGYSKEMGLASGFSFHIVVLGYVSLLGLVGLVQVGREGWARRRVRVGPVPGEGKPPSRP